MKHLGDITKIHGGEIETVDCITGGSPCQDLSVAGKRAGLAGERSGLFMEQIRLIKEMRQHDRDMGRTAYNARPRWMVWENVPGAFSSNGGEDFRAVLEETARVADESAVIPRPADGKWTPAGCIMGDGWSIAWRVHDAQFWGVPQRRKRISLVADFAGGGAPEVLFERKGVSRDFETGRKQREETSRDAGAGAEEPGAISFQERAGKPGGGKGILIQDERTGALSTLNNQSVVYGITAYNSNSMKSDNPNSGIYEAETAKTLDLNGGSPACNQGDGYKEGDTMYTLNSTEQHAVCIGNGQTAQTRISEKVGTLNCMHDQQAVLIAQAWDGSQTSSTLTANNAGGGQRMPDKNNFNAVITYGFDTDKIGSLCARDFKGVGNQYVDEGKIIIQNVTAVDFTNGTEGGINGILQAMASNNTASNNVCRIDSIVRRLTPLECERLQGYPDGWTDIGDWTDSKGKTHKAADSPRYKALGNSIALPFWFWLLRRISATYSRPATLGSLFDGIGGFPLCWERCNGKGTARWASEIEEFPIAVTKKRFTEGGNDIDND